MGNVNWLYIKDEKTPETGFVAYSTINRRFKAEIKIYPDGNIVLFNVELQHGRVESTIKFSESPPAEVKTNDEVVKWIESNIDQLVQNALVKLLTTAVGFFS